MKILLVEDEVLLGLGLKAELEDAGHEVLGPAATTAEAVALAETGRPHVALVDIDLAHPSEGVEVARSLKGRFDVATLFLSGQREVARANTDAALGYIAKPYRLNDVVRSVEIAMLVAAGVAAPARATPRTLELFA